MTQFTRRVTRSPAGRLPTFFTAEKSTFIIIGVIMSQMRKAIGAFIWLPSPNSMPRSKSRTRRERVAVASSWSMVAMSTSRRRSLS